MTKNQIIPRSPKHRAETPAKSSFATARMGEFQLIKARKRLAALRSQYKSGSFSGHPEEMLDSIDGAKQKVERLETAKKRKWVPDAKLIQRLETELLTKEEEFTVGQFKNMPEDVKVANLEMLQRELDTARMGLR